MVDAGTGSGAIALSLATELADRFPAGRVWATDISAEALAVARANLDRTRAERRREVLPVSFAPGVVAGRRSRPMLRGSLDLVVANPPYVADGGWPDLAGEVQQEPYGALVAGDGSDGTPGLADVEQVLAQAWTWLARPGAVVIEMAPDQTDAASRLARSHGVRRRACGAGPGAASAGAGWSDPVSGPRVVSPRHLVEVLQALSEGRAVAVPGDGGYQLAVVHADAEALELLRSRGGPRRQ